MTTLTDRQLANFAYAQQKIPASKWASHYANDTDRHGLSDDARAAYRAIYRSVERAV